MQGGDEIRGRGRPDRASFSRRRLQDRRRSAREVVQQEEKDAGEYHADAAAEQPVEEMIDGDSGPAANQVCILQFSFLLSKLIARCIFRS